MSLRLIRRLSSFTPRHEAADALRLSTIASLHRMAEGDRRRILQRWQRDATGGQQAPRRVPMTADELRARSRVGG